MCDIKVREDNLGDALNKMRQDRLVDALNSTQESLAELTATFNRMGQTLQEFGTACGPVRRSRWSRAVPYITVVSAIVLLACILLAA